MLLLLYQVCKVHSLDRSQNLDKLRFGLLHLFAKLRRDWFHDFLGAFLAFPQDAIDALALLGRKIQFSAYTPQKIQSHAYR